MLPNVKQDLLQLLRSKGVRTTPEYVSAVSEALDEGLSYNTPAMFGMAQTLFQSDMMIAYNLIQNSIDEAKGAARVEIIARRYAPPALKKKMLRHVGDELRHAKQFLDLMKLTPYRAEEDSEGTAAEVFEFDDELKAFLCRVHSIEIRSWTMLRHYISVIRGMDNAKLQEAIPVLESIMADEINHVAYTGETLIEWIAEDPKLRDVMLQCFAHTNRETWHDLANMANYLADHQPALIAARAAEAVAA